MRKLNLVVTCSDRKSLPVSTALRARSLTASTPDERVAEWRDRFDHAGRGIPLRDLYQGDHWTQVRRLAATAANSGYETNLWIASAGLGLRPATDHAPAYGATFAGRQADTVGVGATERRMWWTALRPAFGTVHLTDLGGDAALMIVLSASYSEALESDLHQVALASADAVLIGGRTAVPGLARVRADGRLRSRLGGSLASLNPRMAARWLEEFGGHTLTDPTSLRAWDQWASEGDVDAPPTRQRLRDDQVREFIQLQHAKGTMSRSRLLEQLRESGYACEQRRFGALYKEVGVGG